MKVLHTFSLTKFSGLCLFLVKTKGTPRYFRNHELLELWMKLANGDYNSLGSIFPKVTTFIIDSLFEHFYVHVQKTTNFIKHSRIFLENRLSFTKDKMGK